MYLPETVRGTRELMGVGGIDQHMSQWQRRVDDLLYDGESVLEVVDVGTSQVVVTSHRVLAFTPEMDGRNFQQADRPNAVAVDTSALAKSTLLERGLRYLVIGGVLIVAGTVFDFGSMLGGTELETGGAGQLGLGGIMEITQSLLNLMQNLDQLLQMFGALGLLLAVVLLGVYWFLRDPTLVVEMAGEEEDIHVPRPDDVDQIRTRLEQVILPDPDADAAASTAEQGRAADEPLGEGAVGGGQAVTDGPVATDVNTQTGNDHDVTGDDGSATTPNGWASRDEQSETAVGPEQPSDSDDDEEAESGWRDDLW